MVKEETDRYLKLIHDWEGYKRKDVYDDGTITFFWRAHTLTVLFLMSCALVYVAIFEQVKQDPEYNTKRGLVACILVFLLLGVTQIPDGPFRRPHPALWRFVLCVSIVYELALIFILFQTADDARKLLKHIDKELGKPLAERNYGGNCLIYDPDMPQDPFHNVWDKLDIFVPTHFIGWWVKTLMLRDWWLCMVTSIMFEVLEYTLEHQLPNFSECWWDHFLAIPQKNLTDISIPHHCHTIAPGQIYPSLTAEWLMVAYTTSLTAQCLGLKGITCEPPLRHTGTAGLTTVRVFWPIKTPTPPFNTSWTCTLNVPQ